MGTLSYRMPYWRLSGFYFLHFMAVGGFMPYWPAYLEELGFESFQIGVLSAVFVVTKIVSTYLWGWVVDYYHRRIQIVRLVSCLSVTSFIWVMAVNDFWSLLFATAVFSFFWSASLPQIEAVTLSYLDTNSHTYTLLRVWGSIGFIIAVLSLGFMFETVSVLYLPYAMFSIIFGLGLLTLLIIDFPTTTLHPAVQKFRSVVSEPTVLALLGICFLMLVGHAPYYTFFTLFAELHGYSSRVIGMLWALGVVAEIVVFLVMHRLIARFGLRRLMILSLFLAAVRWGVTGLFIDYIAVLLLMQLLHAATFGIFHAVAIQYIHQSFKGRAQGRGQALYNSVSYGAGLALGSLLSGYFWTVLGPESIFVLAVGVSLIALALAYCYLLRD